MFRNSKRKTNHGGILISDTIPVYFYGRTIMNMLSPEISTMYAQCKINTV